MDIIKEYFKNKTENITFIELKEDARLGIKAYPLNSSIPLPIIIETLVSEIKEGTLKEEMKLVHIIEGIIYLIGVDEDFEYIEDYKKILKAYNDKIDDYTFYKGIRFVESNDYDNAAIYFRALKNINPNHVNGLFNYALALEEIAKEYLAKDDEEVGIEFLTRSTIELETILDVDINYPLAYYKLGYHYKYFNQFLKAKLIWEKYLPLDNDDLRAQEIRDELQIIEDDVILESGLTYLSYDRFSEALDLFLKLEPRHDDWWELKYLIGNCHNGLTNYDLAIEAYSKSLELHKEEADVYNELGITLFTIGDIPKAIEVFTEGIENVSGDYKLLFNRGLGYLQLGDLRNAYIDVESAWKINPTDKNVEDQKLLLEEALEI